MATARRFALTMGMAALIVVCVVGIWRQSSLEATLLRALVALVVFAGIGYVCGLVGGAIMKDAVKTEVARVRSTAEAVGLRGRVSARRGVGRKTATLESGPAEKRE